MKIEITVNPVCLMNHTRKACRRCIK